MTYTEEEREIEKMSLEVLKFKKHIKTLILTLIL